MERAAPLTSGRCEVIGWLIAAGYLTVSALTSRALMRIVMTRPVCTIHQEGWFTGRCFSSYSHTDLYGKVRPDYKRVPLGELVERPLGIAALMTLAGLAWPFTGLVAVTMHARRTPDEMARHNAEMAEMIRGLERQIKGGAS